MREIYWAKNNRVLNFLGDQRESLRERVCAGGENVAIDPEKVELTTEQIGSGATSRVFRGKFRESESVVRDVACKEFMVTVTIKQKMRLLKEIRCLNALHHPNVLEHFGIDFKRGILVTELLETRILLDGEMTEIHNARELLDLNEYHPVPWSTRLQMMQRVTSGLAYLHEKNIVHCDLKAGNVFIGDNGDG